MGTLKLEKIKFLTGEDCPAFVLLVHLSPRLPVFSERRLIHKTTKVVVSFKVCLAFVILSGVEIRRHIRHLDVRLGRVKVMRVYLSDKIRVFILTTASSQKRFLLIDFRFNSNIPVYNWINLNR